MTNGTIHALSHGLAHYYNQADDLEKVIIGAATVAAAMDATASAIPGLALPATVIGCFGTVWVMYGTLCKKLGISLKEKTLKLIGKAVLANIAANLGGLLIGEVVGAFIPYFSVLASAAISFITVYIAGKIFLNLILDMAQRSTDLVAFSDISADEMADFVAQDRISKDDVREAKAARADARP